MNIDTQGSGHFACSLIYFSLEIRLNSVVQSKQSVDQKRPLPLGALRQLPHFASRSYATDDDDHLHAMFS